MAEMIEQLLMLSRLENTSTSGFTKKFDLNERIIGIHRDFSERHPDRKILLSCEDHLKYSGDEALISTALQNLINNALDFSEQDSEVLIEVKSSKKTVEIKVIDQGTGIPDYAQDKVFERFYSLPRPASGRKSSGLGLSITRQIARMHKGDVTLQSSEKGTIAELKLRR